MGLRVGNLAHILPKTMGLGNHRELSHALLTEEAISEYVVESSLPAS